MAMVQMRIPISQNCASRTHAIHTPHDGCGGAKNVAMERASGERPHVTSCCNRRPRQLARCAILWRKLLPTLMRELHNLVSASETTSITCYISLLMIPSIDSTCFGTKGLSAHFRGSSKIRNMVAVLSNSACRLGNHASGACLRNSSTSKSAAT